MLDRLVQLLVANETVDGPRSTPWPAGPEPAEGTGMTMAPDRAAAAAGRTWPPARPPAASGASAVTQRSRPA